MQPDMATKGDKTHVRCRDAGRIDPSLRRMSSQGALLTTSVLLSGAMRMSWTGSASSRGHLVPEPATKEARAFVGFGMNKLLM